MSSQTLHATAELCSHTATNCRESGEVTRRDRLRAAVAVAGTPASCTTPTCCHDAPGFDWRKRCTAGPEAGVEPARAKTSNSSVPSSATAAPKPRSCPFAAVGSTSVCRTVPSTACNVTRFSARSPIAIDPSGSEAPVPPQAPASVGGCSRSVRSGAGAKGSWPRAGTSTAPASSRIPTRMVAWM